MLYPELYKSVLQYTVAPEDEYNELELLFTNKRLATGSYILEAGDICRLGVFVQSGCLSYFTRDKEGNENIIDFATRGWWMADGESFFKKTISPYYIKVVYDADVLLIEPDKFLYAFAQYPFFLYYHYFALLDYRNRTDRLLSGALHTTARRNIMNWFYRGLMLFKLHHYMI